MPMPYPRVSETGAVTEIVVGPVTIQPYDQYLHQFYTVSFMLPGQCAQGGQDTCHRPPVFSVTSKKWSISACEVHVYGAYYRAHAINTSKES